MGWIDNMLEQKLGDLAASVAEEGQRTRLEMAAGLAQTVRGLRIDGARARQISPNTLNMQTGGRLVGWSVRADGGTLQINFRDGRADGDVIAATPLLAAGASDTHTVMPAGVSFAEGLYLEVTGTGTPTGAAWIGAVD